MRRIRFAIRCTPLDDGNEEIKEVLQAAAGIIAGTRQR